MPLKLDREKYLRILRAEGVNAAVTALHQDTERWEFDTFESPEGYQPDMFRDLNEVRNFSRELWELGLSLSPTSGGPQADPGKSKT